MHSPERRGILLVVVLLCALAAWPAAAVVAPPTLTGTGVDSLYFSPNGDGVRDAARYFFVLGGDSAQVVVEVLADFSGTPTKLKRRLPGEYKAAGPDTVSWDGRDSLGVRLADGPYWITAGAANSLGTALADTIKVILDVTGPQDAITLPARPYVSALIHRVAGLGADLSGLARFVATLSSRGGTLTSTICEPCLAETTLFALDVPDSIAGDDTLRVITTLRDNAGNGALHTRLFVVDSLPPDPPVLDPLPVTVERPEIVIAGTAAGAESVFVDFDGGLAASLSVGAGSRFGTTLRGYGLGSHTVSAVSQDRALNRSGASRTLSFVYQEPLGASLPERFQAGDFIQVNVADPARSVTVKIYTLHGRLVRSFEDTSPTTLHEFQWDLTDDQGQAVGSGPYVVRVIAEPAGGAPLEKRLATVVTR